jgi:hypothetical protein
VLGRKLLSRPKRSRNEAVVPYEEYIAKNALISSLISTIYEVKQTYGIIIFV